MNIYVYANDYCAIVYCIGRIFAGYEINCLSKHYHYFSLKVSKGAQIRNRYNQVPHLTQDTKGKVTNSQ